MLEFISQIISISIFTGVTKHNFAIIIIIVICSIILFTGYVSFHAVTSTGKQKYCQYQSTHVHTDRRQREIIHANKNSPTDSVTCLLTTGEWMGRRVWEGQRETLVWLVLLLSHRERRWIVVVKEGIGNNNKQAFEYEFKFSLCLRK